MKNHENIFCHPFYPCNVHINRKYACHGAVNPYMGFGSR